ncbi:MAG: hypothetical protein HXX08_05910 [Chloroflexi bacterium]|uniref:Uncharacterized protein n=1 Tax=Candidatus Chlorohelix allophototropha TaxID=3003348 RepID=A0A8T7LWZ4_9CHLR|nr:hypothetical protein [Chloroflexota bacterium]WJW67269.1 hypothetical protein OZ401_000529 [Chloroflexota bacterium L227-S17]
MNNVSPQRFVSSQLWVAPQHYTSKPVRAGYLGVKILPLFLMTLSALAGGAAIGAIAGSISYKFFSLLFIFTVGMGLLGGAIIYAVYRAAQFRNPHIALIFGILISFIASISCQGTEYLLFKEDFKAQVQSRTVSMYSSDSDLLFDRSLLEQTGSDGLLGYMKLQAQQGINITDASSGEGLVLKDAFAWFYWLAELLFALLASAYVAWVSSIKAYCNNCRHPFSVPNSIGSVKAGLEHQFVTLLRNQQYHIASQLLEPLTNRANRLEVKLERCATCQFSHSIVTTGNVKRFWGSNSPKEVARQEISTAQYQELVYSIHQL